jgi:general L-amino acid transport system substrate-binding protein
MILRFTVPLLTLTAALLAGPAFGETTLESVRAHGALRCGVATNPEDWNKTDLHGDLSPLYLEICKAISVSALGEQARVEAKIYASEAEALEGVSRSDVDVIVGVTPSASAMWQWHVAFGPAIFYDGQAVMVRADSKAASFNDLSGQSICVIEGTDNEKQLQARAHIQGVTLESDAFQEEGEMEDSVAVRRCDGVSAYLSRLGQIRATYPNVLAHDKVLPELLTLAPVAPAYRQGDAQWGMIVDWTVHALVAAEAAGVTRANVGTEAESEDVAVQRLLGTDWAASRALGLDDHYWAAKVIAVAGNYGEIYDRTVGGHGSLGLPRGLNALWTNGGLMHPLPVQ